MHHPRKICPSGKIVYPSMELAIQSLTNILKTQKHVLEPYKCKFCKKIHLGHPRNGIRMTKKFIKKDNPNQKQKKKKANKFMDSLWEMKKNDYQYVK